jgi:hypothetical protein
MQIIDIDKIGGSVGRCLDFDTRFSVRDKFSEEPRISSHR